MKRPGVQAFLSFVWPGLAQALRGQYWRALIQAAPQFVFVVGIVLIAVIRGPLILGAYLLNPTISLSLLVVVLVLAIWHLWSIADALGWPIFRRARAGAIAGPGTLSGPGSLAAARALAATDEGRFPGLTSVPTPGPAAKAWATVLMALVLVFHAWLGYTLVAFYRTSQAIYEPPPPISVLPSSSTTPAPGASSGTSSTPSPPLPGTNGRVTVLLVGLDNTHGDLLALTDTLMVASFDPNQDTLAMISLPRDTAHLPYYAGGTWLPRINSLRQAAVRSPASFPDGPMGTLVNEMSYLVGIPIDYYAVVGIAGFSQLIDAVGGVDINVPKAVNDPGYQFSANEIGFYVAPGWHHFDGKYGTAYARSRHGSSDYARAQRQQQLLLALRSKLSDPSVITNLPGILDAAAQLIRTNAPLDRLPDLLQIVMRSSAADTTNLVLDPPNYAGRVFNSAGEPTSMTQLNMDAVAQLSIQLFGSDSRYAH